MQCEEKLRPQKFTMCVVWCVGDRTTALNFEAVHESSFNFKRQNDNFVLVGLLRTFDMLFVILFSRSGENFILILFFSGLQW
jgi:hypothetical protein